VSARVRVGAVGMAQRHGSAVRVTARAGSSGRARDGYYAMDEEVTLSRSQLMNKPIITRSSGNNLGVVSQLWVDTDTWKVVSLDLRENLLFGELECVLLQSLKQVPPSNPCRAFPPCPWLYPRLAHTPTRTQRLSPRRDHWVHATRITAVSVP
jgi:sporulation protein YlmC with PRC-barrel domain